MALGAGRQRIEDRIDHGAGVRLAKKPGDSVAVGDTIMDLLYNDDRGLPEASRLAESAVRIDETRPVTGPLIIDRLTTGAH
jgi:thymidine phosphorylase